jgi:hypothetical protein
MEVLMALIMGVGLSAACGFRVFVPLLGMSIAVRSGHLEMADGFAWIGSTPALITLTVATLLEIGAYYIPWLDNLLDTLATPAAVIAGTIVTASMVADMSPLLKWGLAVIAGGGAAAVVQAGTVMVRGSSSATTGGGGNFLVSSAELMGAAGTTLLALFVPILVFVLLVVFCPWLAWKVIRCRRSGSRERIFADSASQQ